MSGDESGSESGSALREKLESTLEANKGLMTKLAEATVKEFRYVKPDDLRDVPFDQMAARAAELEQQRADERQAILKEELEQRGLTGDQLTAALAKKAEPSKPAPSPFASTAQLQGTPPGHAPQQGLYGVSRIRASLGE